MILKISGERRSLLIYRKTVEVLYIIKNWIHWIMQLESRVFIGLAIIGYEPLYSGPLIFEFFGGVFIFVQVFFFSKFWGIFNKTVIPLAPVLDMT